LDEDEDYDEVDYVLDHAMGRAESSNENDDDDDDGDIDIVDVDTSDDSDDNDEQGEERGRGTSWEDDDDDGDGDGDGGSIASRVRARRGVETGGRAEANDTRIHTHTSDDGAGDAIDRERRRERTQRAWRRARVAMMQQFDYRWQSYSSLHSRMHHQEDASLMTFRGHRVLETLIRCYFSPAFTTGCRYIYTGSQCGVVYIYDSLTGETCSHLEGHHGRTSVAHLEFMYTQLIDIYIYLYIYKLIFIM
jgi:hypothetical protein